ncbi:MAG: septal ring lytic transglycosylase RlpA family protein [Opitutaceae bacterium]|nr:septal ring lytic transglycosylase RlpA family protein [Opitutaceae bacterium]
MINLLKVLLICAGISSPLLAFETSWYGEEYRGKAMANGQPYVPEHMTCAANRFALGTRLKITYKGRVIWVVVTDRTHKRFSHRIDLSSEAFRRLARLEEGIIRVRVEVER